MGGIWNFLGNGMIFRILVKKVCFLKLFKLKRYGVITQFIKLTFWEESNGAIKKILFQLTFLVLTKWPKMVRNFSWFCNLFIRTWSKHQYYHSSIITIVLTLHPNLKKPFKEILNINFLWQRVEIFEEDSRKEEVFVLYNTLSNPYYGRSSFHGWKWHNVFCVDKDWRKRNIFWWNHFSRWFKPFNMFTSDESFCVKNIRSNLICY